MNAMDYAAFPLMPTDRLFELGMTPCFGMNLHAYAAIHLRVPASGIPELDAMIRQARRQEMVGRALQGLLANPGGPIQHNPMRGWDLTNSTWDDVASVAATAADAAIKAMEEKP